MRQTKLDFDKFHGTNLPRLAVVAILLTGWFPVSSMAQQKSHRTFSSAQDATSALVVLSKATTKNRYSIFSGQTESKSFLREMTLRMRTTALTLCADIRKCTV